MTTVILFVFGTIVGSFLNVVGLRFNSGTTLGGRSHCPACGKTLSALELVPILSFLFQGGRCRGCQARISFQYPLVELWTGLVFMTIFNFQFSIFQNILLLGVFSIYIAITIYDMRHQIIPDRLVFIAIALALVLRVLSGGEPLDYLAGPIIALFFASIWLLSKGRAMGFGDAKLGLSIGLLLGWLGGISAMILSFWLGAGVGLILILFTHLSPLSQKGREITIKSAIPFAPFMILGAWLTLIFNLDLLHVTLF